jgi:hypothetical protein
MDLILMHPTLKGTGIQAVLINSEKLKGPLTPFVESYGAYQEIRL